MVSGSVPVWFGNYLISDALAEKDGCDIEFPMAQTTERYTANDQTFMCQFRRNILVDSPGGCACTLNKERSA